MASASVNRRQWIPWVLTTKMAPELAAGIARVESAKMVGVRAGNWHPARQAQNLAGPGVSAFVPPGVAHSFGNTGTATARILVIASPPGHEKYFNELAELVSKGGPPDPEAIAKLRAKYDTIQVSALVSE
jgi:hypothetical protein